MFCCCAEDGGGETLLAPVKLDNADQVLPNPDDPPETCFLFTVELDRVPGSSFGVDISAAGKVCMVNGIEEGSLIGVWNSQSTLPEHQIRKYDRLMSLNGEKPAKGKDMLERLRDTSGPVTIVVQRPVIQKVKVKKNDKDLGVSVIDGQSFLLVTRISDGAISEHNLRAPHPKDVIRVPSRIVTVDGKKGKGSELLKFMEESKTSFEVEMLCYD
eukprot:symbB.v1.2.020399.t1/scaffold1714.1/size104981/3